MIGVDKLVFFRGPNLKMQSVVFSIRSQVCMKKFQVCQLAYTLRQSCYEGGRRGKLSEGLKVLEAS